MSRLAQGVRAEDYPELSADLQDMLEHLKWNLWHGKVDRALEIVDELVYALDVEDGSPEHRKLLKTVRAFETYVTNHRAAIPNYGERYRQGKNDFDGLRGVGRQPGGQQAFCEKAADAMDAGGRPPFAANPDPGVKRRLARHAAGADRPAEATTPYDGGVASGLARSQCSTGTGAPRCPGGTPACS
jgi:hypothetical protein